jgi:hypothetical protein
VHSCHLAQPLLDHSIVPLDQTIGLRTGGVDGHLLDAHAITVLLEAAAKLSALVNPHSVGDAKKKTPRDSGTSAW